MKRWIVAEPIEGHQMNDVISGDVADDHGGGRVVTDDAGRMIDVGHLVEIGDDGLPADGGGTDMLESLSLKPAPAR